MSSSFKVNDCDDLNEVCKSQVMVVESYPYTGQICLGDKWISIDRASFFQTPHRPGDTSVSTSQGSCPLAITLSRHYKIVGLDSINTRKAHWMKMSLIRWDQLKIDLLSMGPLLSNVTSCFGYSMHYFSILHALLTLDSWFILFENQIKSTRYVEIWSPKIRVAKIDSRGTYNI